MVERCKNEEFLGEREIECEREKSDRQVQACAYLHCFFCLKSTVPNEASMVFLHGL